MTKTLEIMVLTHNRLGYLKQTISSILASTVCNIPITVLNNASDDGTGEYLDNLAAKNSNVKYITHSTLIPASENTKSAINNMTCDYAVIFHDDDIMHPQFIEAALKIINEFEDIDLICTGKNTFFNVKEIETTFYDNINLRLFKNKEDFAEFVYINKWGNDLCFPSVIYKVENLKNMQYDNNMYGKIGDKPFTICAINDGKCVYIEDAMINYRVHENQDSKTNVNGPFDFEIINFNIFFKNMLSHSFFKRMTYNVHSWYWLKSLNKWGYPNRSIKPLIDLALENNTVNLYTYLIGNSKYSFILKGINYCLKKIIHPKFKRAELSLNQI